MGAATLVDPLDIACHTSAMEDTRPSLELVHVLRHTFRPSDQLEEALEQFLPPDSKRPAAHLEIRSLGSIALNVMNSAPSAYSLRLIDARKGFEKNRNQSFEILPRIKARQVGEKTLDILMGVHRDLSLDMLMQATRQRLPEGVQMKDPSDRSLSVYARIQSSVPIDDTFQVEATGRFVRTYRSLGPPHLFNIIPEGIAGMDQYIPIPQTSSYDESS